ncbi:MAG: restriction endonuclease subunit S [Sedimenticola sp.]
MNIGGLPSSWVLSSIGDICSYVQRGKGPKYAKQPNEFPVINQKAIRWHGIEEAHLKFVDETQWGKWDEIRFVREGDILWNSTGTGTIGRACYLSELEAKKAKVVDSHVTIVRSVPHVEAKFVFYWIMHPEIQSKVGGLYTGSTNQVELSKTMVLGTEIPIPPLAEQKQIAAKLDELLAQVDTLKNRLDAIPTILKRFRQSVLSAAVSGSLTEDWRGAGSYEAVLETYDAPVAWKRMQLGDLATLVTSGSRGWAKYYSTEGATFIRAQNIKFDILNLDDVAFVSLPERVEGSRTRVQQNDLLVTITGANVTRCAMVVDPLQEAYVSQHVALVRLENVRFSLFLEIVLMAPNAGRKQLNDVAYGGGKSGLNLGNIQEVVIALPTEEEQSEIVSRVDHLFGFINLIEQRLVKAQSRVNQLTQSILAKAFRGELTTDWRERNPLKISDENSVEALLIKIATERELAVKPKTRRAKMTRKKKMAKSTVGSMEKAINQMPDGTFTFDELREKLMGDYEEIQQLLFQLLSGDSPSLRQVFDEDAKQMKLERVGL